MPGFVKENEAAIKLAAKVEAYSKASGGRQRCETGAILRAHGLIRKPVPTFRNHALKPPVWPAPHRSPRPLRRDRPPRTAPAAVSPAKAPDRHEYERATP